jgi:hypothetical protein
MGNNPVLGGSVLNEGNAPAQFVNVEMLHKGQSQSQQASVQYLGNIATNSSKPINIPLHDVPILSSQRQNNISSYKNEAPLLTGIALNSPDTKSFAMGVEKNNTTPGIYPVSLKITYYDDLKNSHDLIIDSPVQINPAQPEETSNQGNGLFAILIAAIIIAIGIAVIILKKWPERNVVSVSKKLFSSMESAHPPDKKRQGAPFSPI